MTDPKDRDRDVLAALRKQRARLSELEAKLHGPIAITGMGCRFPGADAGPDAYQQLLSRGRTALRDLPDGRWDAGAYFSADPDVAGAMYTLRAGLLRQPLHFDAPYFGIARREAQSMDPQQRLLLEVCYEALEDAQQDVHALRGANAGVFVGMCTSDYATMMFSPAQLQSLTMHSSTGCSNAAMAGRLSYLLGLHGPSMVIDTACSSALVALHLACRSLRAGEVDLALVAGVNLILNPASMVAQCKLRALSPTGRSAPFDASADGYVRGEGCGALVLRRLPDAVSAGDTILGVVRGSAVQQDGRSAGLTAPSSAAQRSVIRAALQDANCDPLDVSYVEAHGTGTALGDPVELEALRSVYGGDAPRKDPLWLGSVKSNIGHLEGAAGVASLIKVLLALRARELYPSLSFERPNPNFTWQDSGLSVVTERQPWSAGDRPLVAGVSSFGFSGTVAHVILEAAPTPQVRAAVDHPEILHVSARSAGALHALEGRYAHVLADATPDQLAPICRASRRRVGHEHRSAFVIDGPNERQQLLRAWQASESPAGRMHGRADMHLPARVVLVFSGQGWQRPGMCLPLLAESAVFKDALHECDRALHEHLGWSVVERLEAYRQDADLERSEFLQPVLFAVQVAIVRCLEAAGVVANAVLGHSLGEVGAAYISGILSLPQAALIVAERSRLAQTKSLAGGMLAVELGASELQSVLARHGNRVDVAAHNGPRSSVLSGDKAELEAFASVLREQGVQVKALRMDVANHSRQLDTLCEPLRSALADLEPSAARTAFYSTVDACRLKGLECDAAYWARHLREPVLFTETIRSVAQEGRTIFVEVGAHAVLAHAIEETLLDGDYDAQLTGSLISGRPDARALSECIARLWTWGAALRAPAAAAEPTPGALTCMLPRYAWDHEAYPLSLQARSALAAARSDGLVGTLLTLPDDTQHSVLSLGEHGNEYLLEHRVYGRAIVPGALHLARAMATFEQVTGANAQRLRNVVFEQPQIFGASQLHAVTLRASDRGAHAFIAASKIDASVAEWQRHTSGTLETAATALSAHSSNAHALAAPAGAELVSGTALRERFARHGVTLGAPFAWVDSAWRSGRRAVAKLICPPNLTATSDAQRVTLIDACLQVVGLLADTASDGVAYVPVSIREAVLTALTGQEFWCVVQAADANGDEINAAVTLLDDQATALAHFEGICVRAWPRSLLSDGAEVGLAMKWEPEVLPTGPEISTSSFALVDCGAAFVGELRSQLQSAGARCAVLDPDYAFEAHGSLPDAIVIAADAAVSDVTQIERAVWALIAAAKLASKSDARPLPRLWIVTEGAQAVLPGEQVAFGPSALWGALRTLLVEHPELSPRGIDFADSELRDVAALLLAEPKQDHLALRAGQTWLGSLERMSFGTLACSSVSSTGVHVITGGLGGLGMELAQQLVELGAKSLLLIARSKPSAEAAARLQALSMAGANCEVVQADVADRASLSAALTRAREQHGSIVGVYHLAATLADGLVQSQTQQNVHAAMHAKVAGALLLHELTQADALQHFVMYSSAASLLGSSGQINYGAANAVVDALAAARRARGLAGLAIHWGPVAGAGRAQLAADLSRFRAIGIEPLALPRVRTLLSRALAGKHAQFGAVDIDVRRFLEHTPHLAGSSLWSRLRLEVGDDVSAPRGQLATRLRSLAGRNALRELDEYLRAVICESLRAPRDVLTSDKRFGDLGMDSMLAMEIKHRLERDLDLRLRASLLISHPTLEALGRVLADELGLEPAIFEPADTQILDDQSVEDIAAQLAAHL